MLHSGLSYKVQSMTTVFLKVFWSLEFKDILFYLKVIDINFLNLKVIDNSIS
jgi:hypothetical protein